VTTVDFWADPIEPRGPRIALSNGLSGPATASFHRLRDLIDSGVVEGTADIASARGRLSGAQLREVLGDALAELDEPLRDSIHDDIDYAAAAVEV
jgi:hypothetical protein